MTTDAERLQEVHKTFLNIMRRAEKHTDDVLTRTFVDTAPLMDSLHTLNSQVIYGRRGTGKTHALKYLAKKVREHNDRPVFIDLRSVGSNGAVYADFSRPAVERALGLVLDVINVISDELFTVALENIETAIHPDQISKRIDDLSAALADVKIVGDLTKNEKLVEADQSDKKSGVSLTVKEPSPSFKIDHTSEKHQGKLQERELSITGREQRHIDFARVQGALRSLIEILGRPRIWLLIDEWSEVPLDLQPYLADLLRRTVLPLELVVLKIAAIEHRSNFRYMLENGEYIGLEVGADVSADVNLDDFLVFDNDQERSVNFFKLLLFRHYIAASSAPTVASAEELIRLTFTQFPAFEELVRAAEGVPRDAINLMAIIARKVYGKSAAMQDVRVAARDWYQQDKATVLKASPSLERLMSYVVDTVIGKRRARAFLFSSNIRNRYIDQLFDGRILHLLKRNVSSKEEAGKRFDVYKIDYGCYVDKINTKHAPQGLFTAIPSGGGDEVDVDVPVDDYRSIRRAILSAEELDEAVDP